MKNLKIVWLLNINTHKLTSVVRGGIEYNKLIEEVIVDPDGVTKLYEEVTAY